MAAEVKKTVSVEPKLIKGGKGIFDVKVDGKLVYSKYKTNTFPPAGEIARLLKGV